MNIFSILLLCSTLCHAQQPPKTPLPVALQPASVQMEPGAPVAEPGAFTIAIMPDTQFYAQLHPHIFHKQTQWIADNTAKYKIKLVIQVGDVTETSAEAEWIVARDAFKRLEGTVPFSSAPGNHDYGGRLQTFARRSAFSTWLPVTSFQAMPTFGGVYDKQPEKTYNQKDVNGGNGWLRLLQVLPDGKTVRCQDYSPLIDQRCTMPDRTFDFELPSPSKK